MSFAVLDVGTNTLRVLVRDNDNDLFRKNYYLFLGNEVVNGKLTYQGVKKLENTLNEIKQIFLENEVENFVAVATAFARKLHCEKELKDIFYTHLGVNLNIIDGEEEGRIVAKAVENCFKINKFSVFDIGGGSSEIILKAGDDIIVKSLEIGSLFLKRQFFQSIPPTSEEKNEFCEFVLKKIKTEFKGKINEPVFGVGGTITTVAHILSGEKVYNRNLINGFKINIKDLEKLYHAIEYMTPEKIKEIYPIENGRGNVLLSGVLLVLIFMNHFSLKDIIASDVSLLEGLIYLIPK